MAAAYTLVAKLTPFGIVLAVEPVLNTQEKKEAQGENDGDSTDRS